VKFFAGSTKEIIIAGEKNEKHPDIAEGPEEPLTSKERTSIAPITSF